MWQAAVVAVLGSFGSFALVGALSIAGKRGGAPALTLSRAVFGVRGNAGPTLVTWMSRLGWETINTTTAAFAVDLMARRSYDSAALMDVGRSSRYWFRGGVAWAAMIAWATAIVVGLLFTEASTSATDVWFSGPLAHS